MRDSVTELFDEYVRRREAGERPDVEALLQRAGDRAPELGERIDAYLVSAPAPTPSPELIAAMGAWMEGEPTLLAVRTGRRARRADVVERLRSLLGLPENARERLAENYHRLETGLLDVSRIDERLRSALDQVLGARIQDLPLWAPPAPDVAAMMPRLAAPIDEPTADVAFSLAHPDPVEAEVDRLFGIS